jgi:hypothetical protein
MQITITPTEVPLILPISLIFWGVVAAYVLHILEESTLGETFVAKMQARVWPEYGWKHFIGFNTILLSLNILAIALYEVLGGAWVIFPLGMAFERIFNGFWHLIESLVTKRFASGLLTSLLFWILGYFLVRYAFLQDQIPDIWILISGIIGLALTGAMFGSMQWMKKIHFPLKN